MRRIAATENLQAPRRNFVYVRGAPEHDEVSSPRHLCADFKTYKDVSLAFPGHSKITRLIHVDIELDCRAKEAV
jgi:hypothetical protein